MQQLKIWDKEEESYITLPRDHSLVNGGEVVAKEVQMAAGNIVTYVQGYRPSLSVTFDYFPADLLTQLTSLIRQGGWFKVDYPDLDGADKSGYFKITPSQMGVFAYRNGSPVWRGLTLTFVSREVV